jgi:hypothetical protein
MPEPATSPMPKRSRLGVFWATCWRGFVKYRETDGEQRAASAADGALDYRRHTLFGKPSAGRE